MLTLASVPAVSATAKGASLLAEVLELPLRPLAPVPEPEMTQIDLARGGAHLYRPGGQAPGVLLVHGVAPEGPSDPRMQRVASGLAKLGRTVLAPELALADQKLDPQDPARIRDAIQYLRELTGDSVTVISFSFGAAYTLVALQQQPEVQSSVRLLATVGTYFDLVHLLQGVTTGRVTGPGGELRQWTPDPEAGRIVIEFLAEFVGPAQGSRLIQAYEEEEPRGLSPAARSIYDLMTNEDPGRTQDLVAALPGPLPEAISALSPASGMDRITVPVRAMHSRQDPASPPSESELMVQALEPPASGSVSLVGSFRHVNPGQGASLWQDAPALIDFAQDVLRVQEDWGIDF